MNLQAFKDLTLIKRDSNTGVFLWKLRNFEEHFFTEHLWCLLLKLSWYYRQEKSFVFWPNSVIFSIHADLPLCLHEDLLWVFSIKRLKVHSCRYENLAIYSSLYKNRIMQIAHYNTFHFLRYAHFRFAKCLFTNIQKQ